MNENEKQEEEEVIKKLEQEVEAELMKTSLPKSKFMGSEVIQLVKHENFWYGSDYIKSIMMLQRHFVARDSDVIIASQLKTGTTWLKSLLFSVVNRFQKSTKESPLLKHNPHELVHGLEAVYGGSFTYPRPHNLKDLLSPRLFSTHLSYSSLPESIKTSECRVLYICRNPLDTCVSLYHFSIKIMKKRVGEDFKPPSIEEFFEDYFYEGKSPCGPFFDNVLEFWKASLEHPEKVLFLQYEDLKDDPVMLLKRMAKFIGRPFSPQEESRGVINDIIELCSFNTLKELEVNKSKEIAVKYSEKNGFFRKGEVGDWTNHFTPHTVEKMNNFMQAKLEGTGLSFKLLPLQ